MDNNDLKSIINIRILKAKETIDDARIAIESARYRNALNRIYYAAFYIVSALSLKHGFSTSKHKQLMGWFIKTFVSTGIIKPDFSNIYKRELMREGKKAIMMILSNLIKARLNQILMTCKPLSQKLKN